jgi:hypothetical protein
MPAVFTVASARNEGLPVETRARIVRDLPEAVQGSSAAGRSYMQTREASRGALSGADPTIPERFELAIHE